MRQSGVRSRVQKFPAWHNKSRAKCKMLWGIYSAIYGEVNVSVETCVEIKGDYVEKQQICFISDTLKSWSGRKPLDPITYFYFQHSCDCINVQRICAAQGSRTDLGGEVSALNLEWCDRPPPAQRSVIWLLSLVTISAPHDVSQKKKRQPVSSSSHLTTTAIWTGHFPLPDRTGQALP